MKQSMYHHSEVLGRFDVYVKVCHEKYKYQIDLRMVHRASQDLNKSQSQGGPGQDSP